MREPSDGPDRAPLSHLRNRGRLLRHRLEQRGHYALPIADKKRHVGGAVAVVVAETARQAQDAAEEVVVDYRELPWIAQIKDVLTPRVPPRCGTRSPTTSWSTLFLATRRRPSAPSPSPIT